MDKMRELREWVEARVDMVKPLQSIAHVDFRGLPHVTFTTGGIKQQGETLPVTTSHIDKAIELYKEEFLKFLQKFPEGQLKILQWRMYPTEISDSYSHSGFPDITTFYCVVSRFSIAGY